MYICESTVTYNCQMPILCEYVFYRRIWSNRNRTEIDRFRPRKSITLKSERIKKVSIFFLILLFLQLHSESAKNCGKYKVGTYFVKETNESCCLHPSCSCPYFLFPESPILHGATEAHLIKLPKQTHVTPIISHILKLLST